MKKCFPLLGLLLIFFGSCNTKESKQDAIDYNDKIIGEQTKIITLTMEMVKAMDSDIEKCKELRAQIEKQCDESIKVIDAMEPFAGNTKLKSAGLDLFKFYKKTYSTDYKTMFEILDKGADITPEDVTEIQDMQTRVSTEEMKLDMAFKTAQQDFAKEHGFQIAPSELQKEIDNM